jgi:hypothetical protein
MDLPLSVLSQIARTLEQLSIRYVLVGSFASSIHGMYRATADIDIVAEIKTEHVRPLFEALRDDFYVDEQSIREAVTQQRSFNIIHFDSVFKIDFFIPKSDDFANVELDRRQIRTISPNSEDVIYVATAEDTVLAKLRWFRAGHEVSTNQWHDVVGILATSLDTLDLAHLFSWSEKLGITDLLQKALDEVKPDSTI